MNKGWCRNKIGLLIEILRISRIEIKTESNPNRMNNPRETLIFPRVIEQNSCQNESGKRLGRILFIDSCRNESHTCRQKTLCRILFNDSHRNIDVCLGFFTRFGLDSVSIRLIRKISKYCLTTEKPKTGTNRMLILTSVRHSAMCNCKMFDALHSLNTKSIPTLIKFL